MIPESDTRKPLITQAGLGHRESHAKWKIFAGLSVAGRKEEEVANLPKDRQIPRKT